MIILKIKPKKRVFFLWRIIFVNKRVTITIAWLIYKVLHGVLTKSSCAICPIGGAVRSSETWWTYSRMRDAYCVATANKRLSSGSDKKS